MLTTAAPTSTSCIRSLYCLRNAFQPGSLASSASLFDPYFSRRATTSAALRPVAGSTSRARQTAAGSMSYQVAAASTGGAGSVDALIANLLPRGSLQYG